MSVRALICTYIDYFVSTEFKIFISFEKYHVITHFQRMMVHTGCIWLVNLRSCTRIFLIQQYLLVMKFVCPMMHLSRYISYVEKHNLISILLIYLIKSN